MYDPLQQVLQQSGVNLPSIQAMQSAFAPKDYSRYFQQPQVISTPGYSQGSFQQQYQQPVQQPTQPSGGSNPSIAPLQQAANRVAAQKLKYSQGRGKGCTDCSAFTQKVYKDAFGKDIGSWTGEQQKAGIPVNPAQRRAGDLVFFQTEKDTNKPNGISHVGFDNGDGTFTHFSSSGGGGVKVTPYNNYAFPVVSARRVL